MVILLSNLFFLNQCIKVVEGKGSELIKLKKQIQLVWLETANRSHFLYLLEHGKEW